MREIQLSRGRGIALVDDEDYERVLSVGPWQIREMRHGARLYRYGSRKIKGKTVMLHRFIMSAPSETTVDHVDCDGLNNVRRNLRLCTAQQNMQNRRARSGASSRYHGVQWHKWGKKWATRVSRVHVGLFDTEEAAARAYDDAARQLHGEFARLNFPKDGEQSAVA